MPLNSLTSAMSDDSFNKALENLKTYWGFDAFRSGQDEVVKSVLAGNETLVLFPTGGGKSLCYQVPATVLPGLTLVISPLVALMQDQVDQLKKRGISAAFINSTLSSKEVEQRIVNASNGMYKLLYCAPERLETSFFKAEASSLNIQLVAVDEAHCISEWGHDFRPPYRKIRQNIEESVGSTRWMALTATATPKVSDDISEVLGFRNPTIISKGFERKNLKWWVDITEQKETRLLQMVRKAPGSGLIYAGTRRLCNELAALVRKEGIQCEAYHAGLPSEERARIQQQWIDNTLKVVVATNAFGMGIDKPDCRYVIHYDMSYSLEAYYQEAGRAGRDGELSFPTLLVRESDLKIARKRMGDSYPDYETLQNVYRVMCDSLHLAIGSEQDDTEMIDLRKLATRCGYHISIIRSSLRVLNRLGVIEMNEISDPQLGIQFIPDRDELQHKVSLYTNEAKAQFTDSLIRLFLPEALSKMHFIDSDAVLSKLGVTYNALVKGLEVLKSEGLFNYSMQQDDPRIRLTEARSSKLPVSREQAEQFRKIQFDKLEKMIGYAQTRSCRSYYIRSYFGEKKIPKSCGMCDSCLQKSESSAVPSQVLIKNILATMSHGPLTLENIVQKTQVSESEIKVVLKWLSVQRKIAYDRKEKTFRSLI